MPLNYHQNSWGGSESSCRLFLLFQVFLIFCKMGMSPIFSDIFRPAAEILLAAAVSSCYTTYDETSKRAWSLNI